MNVCPNGATVVIESTVSPGTIDKQIRPIIEKNGFKLNKDIYLVHAPERIIQMCIRDSYNIRRNDGYSD